MTPGIVLAAHICRVNYIAVKAIPASLRHDFAVNDWPADITLIDAAPEPARVYSFDYAAARLGSLFATLASAEAAALLPLLITARYHELQFLSDDR